MLLRFGAHRDPVLVARLVQYNLIGPEHANWKAGHRAAVAYRERKVVVSRSWEEELPDGTIVRLGVWLSNTRSRRAGLTHKQREQLATLGVEWAGGTA